jgi:hypothetical protein
MSYVGGSFNFDIFISYARANRGGNVSALRDWSLAFARELNKHLLFPKEFSASEERALRVFIDESTEGVKGLQPLEGQIRTAAESSALLTVLMSNDYLVSDWCCRELKWWDQSQKSLKLPNDRIAVVRIEPTSETGWPSRLKDERGFGLPGYKFHDAPSRPRDIVLPYGYPIPSLSAPGPFQEVFFRLMNEIWKQLQTTRDQLEEFSKAQSHASKLLSPEPTVYLHGRADQEAYWHRLYETLEDDGFIVLPTSPDPILKDPVEEQEFYEIRLQTMRDCDAVLVMGTPNDGAFDADLSYITRRARRSLQSRGFPLLPCALLDLVGPAGRVQKRKTLADRLSVTWIDSHQEPWTPHVRAWLQSVGQSGGPQ